MAKAKKLNSKPKAQKKPKVKNGQPLIPAAISVRAVAQEETGIVRPLVRFKGEEHLLETFNKDEDTTPEIKAIGYMRLDREKIHGWVSYTITIKGDKVLKVEISSPDMRAIAEDMAKTAFVENFIDKDLM